MRRVLAMVMVCASLALAGAPTSRPPASPTSEASRLAAEYFIQKAGASWTYQMAGKNKARWSINSFVEWRASFSFSLGKRSGGGQWFVREGTLIERSQARADGDAVLLPAVMTRGTRWVAPASIERGTRKPMQFEVIALDAQMEMPNGPPIENCLAVLETSLDGQDPMTHYWVPNMGKVGVRGAADWLYRLLDFKSGQRGHAE